MFIPYVNLVEQHMSLRAELLQAVERVLDHGQFVCGAEVQLLESQLAEFLGAKTTIGVNSGTDALVLSLRLHNIGPGDEVITTAHSFVATASAIMLVGATPVFADIDDVSALIDPSAIEAAITNRTRAVIPVHLNGCPCEMDAILGICVNRDLVLIEDCAQSIGARFRGRMTGTFGTGAFSLHPLKVLSACGDAGFVAVNNEKDAERLQALRNIGLVSRDHCAYIGLNSRLDTLQAAMLLVKLQHLEAWIEARRRHAQAYRSALEGKVMLPAEAPGCEPVYSSFVIRHPRRDALLQALRARGVDARVHYPRAIHQQPAFARLHPPKLPATEKVVSEIISLPVSPELDAADRDRVIDAVQESLEEFDQ